MSKETAIEVVLPKKKSSKAAYQPLRITPLKSEIECSRRTVSSPDLRRELEFKSLSTDDRAHRFKQYQNDIHLI